MNSAKDFLSGSICYGLECAGIIFLSMGGIYLLNYLANRSDISSAVTNLGIGVLAYTVGRKGNNHINNRKVKKSILEREQDISEIFK
jgi:hypothetical protein